MARFVARMSEESYKKDILIIDTDEQNRDVREILEVKGLARAPETATFVANALNAYAAEHPDAYPPEITKAE